VDNTPQALDYSLNVHQDSIFESCQDKGNKQRKDLEVNGNDEQEKEHTQGT